MPENRNDYLIMAGNVPVAEWKDGRLTVLNDALLPLYLKRVHNAELWLETRAIDSHRANSRLLKKALRLRERDDISTVLHVNGATITDRYWIKPADSTLCYEDIRFDNDYFAGLALRGTYASFDRAARSAHSRTPELTNIGSFEKCWKLVNGQWWMYKAASHDEMFSELFICAFGKRLGMRMAEYERGDGYVKSRDFTDAAAVNFEPAFTFMGDDDDYEAVTERLEQICPNALPDYIRMIWLDTVTANPDRHTANFGLLRDASTGELLGLAPLFDHNMALISRGYPGVPRRSDLLITLFNDLLSENPSFRTYLPTVTPEIVRDTAASLHMRVRTQQIVDLICARDALIKR